MFSLSKRSSLIRGLFFFACSALGYAGQLTISWDDQSAQETGFKVERSVDGAAFSAIGTVGVNVTSFIDSNVSPATSYWYRVCAYNTTTTSAFSNLTSITTPAAPTGTVPTTPPVTTPPVTISSRLSAVTIQAVAAPWGSEGLTMEFSTAYAAKNLLLRAIGPGLAPYTQATKLGDPRLSVFAGTTLLNSNDNWGGTAALRTVFEQVGAFPLPPTSKDAALVASFAANRYSATIKGDTAGLVQAEIFDADSAVAPVGRLTRFLGRAPVGTGSAVLVAGFTISGDSSLRLLVRAIGPSLTGLQGVLYNPQLQLYRGSTLLSQNDNWGGSSALSTLFQKVSASPLSSSSKDAALDVTLPPGSYTAVISGVSSTKGIGRIEFYVVP